MFVRNDERIRSMRLLKKTQAQSNLRNFTGRDKSKYSDLYPGLSPLRVAPIIPSKNAYLTFNRGGPLLWTHAANATSPHWWRDAAPSAPPAMNPFAELRKRIDPLRVFAVDHPQPIFSNSRSNRTKAAQTHSLSAARPQSISEASLQSKRGQSLKEVISNLFSNSEADNTIQLLSAIDSTLVTNKAATAAIPHPSSRLLLGTRKTRSVSPPETDQANFTPQPSTCLPARFQAVTDWRDAASLFVRAPPLPPRFPPSPSANLSHHPTRPLPPPQTAAASTAVSRPPQQRGMVSQCAALPPLSATRIASSPVPRPPPLAPSPSRGHVRTSAATSAASWAEAGHPRRFGADEVLTPW